MADQKTNDAHYEKNCKHASDECFQYLNPAVQTNPQDVTGTLSPVTLPRGSGQVPPKRKSE